MTLRLDRLAAMLEMRDFYAHRGWIPDYPLDRDIENCEQEIATGIDPGLAVS